MRSMFVWIMVFISAVAYGQNFNLTILHMNDIHVRIEEINKYGSICKPGSDCYGGIERVSSKIMELRNTTENPIFLFGGDFFQGTIWYTLFKWKAPIVFSNAIKFDVMALGNHEFDDSVAGLLPFLLDAQFPVVCVNLDASKNPVLEKLVKKSVVLTVANKTIGVIGYVTLTTPIVSRPDKYLSFTDEIESISAEAKILKAKRVDIIIALGHSGYTRDQEIAAKVPEVDVVVGGHSHSFLYTTHNGVKLPSNDKPVGKYPTMVTQPSGKQVPVVQAFAFTKYIGVLYLTFAPNNTLLSWGGDPVLLDDSVPKDPKITELMLPYKKELYAFESEIVGSTEIELNVSRIKESNFGNFITDCFSTQFGDGVYLAVMNSGGIRSNLEPGNITRADILTVFPFEDALNAVNYTGADIKRGFEYGISQMKPEGSNRFGEFLQVSGFKVWFDVTCEKGHKLVKLQVRDRHDPTCFEDIKDHETYTVVMTNFVLGTYTGRPVFSSDNLGVKVDLTPDSVILSQCIGAASPIKKVKVGNRIHVQTSKSSEDETRKFIQSLEV